MNCSALNLTHTATAATTANVCRLKNDTFLTTSTATVTSSTNIKSNITANPHTVTVNNNPQNLSPISGIPITSNDIKYCKKTDLAAKIVQQSHIICFDVDSTVIQEEGIDELANFCGKGIEVARVTQEAMGGAITFQDALNIRLNIIRPTQYQIADFVKLCPSTLTRNVKHFFEHLKVESKEVYLISGGFDCLIEPVAKELGIPPTNVFANKLMFYYNGEYASFDTTQPTSKTGGKAEVISIIKARKPSALVTMIGDGATDLEAKPPADYFIGFGGNIVRAEVFKGAQYYITDFQQLLSGA